MGCDNRPIYRTVNRLVSIHAPVWGATNETPARPLPHYGFNPRTRVGCDHKLVALPHRKRFQSTHPCGVRQLYRKTKSQNASFNPRTRVGCDTLCTSALADKAWFQSTHPCGVRLRQSSGASQGKSVSIHAPVWGATVNRADRFLGLPVSIHAPVWGATVFHPLLIAYDKFQSTHPCGVRRPCLVS